MTMTNVPMPLGERTQIDVRAIESELTSLWKQAAEHQDEDNQAITRTCVLNLLVATPGGSALDSATETIASLTARHPNRAIVISAAPDRAPELLDAWAQAHCRMPRPGRPQVCCEQITIEAHGAAVARVPGTVLPLLVPDLPVMFWWPAGEPFDDVLFPRLCNLADRVIVDSATFPAPEAGMPHLAHFLDTQRAISDLAWARLTPWRELIAQFFDAPAMAAHLQAIQHIAIEYEIHPNAPLDRTQAFLLVGWLGSRLGWQISRSAQREAGVTTMELARPGGEPIAVELRPVDQRDDLLDRLASCVLECPQGRFSVERAERPDEAVARVAVAGMQPIERVVRLQQMDRAALLANELQMLGRDYGFEGALKLAAALLA